MTEHQKKIGLDVPSFPHPDSKQWKNINTKRPFECGVLGIDGRNQGNSSVSGRYIGQALSEWADQNDFTED